MNVKRCLTQEASNALRIVCKVSQYMPETSAAETIGNLILRRLKDLNISKAELAKRVGVSRAYIGDLANQTAKTQTGFYRPGPEIVQKLAHELQVPASEILNAIGYTTERNGAQPSKPQNVAEFLERLSAMGFELYRFSAEDLEELGPDDLQGLIDQIQDNILGKARRRKNKAA